MATYVVLISLFFIEVAIGEKLLEPTKKCIPSSTIQGACHVCVCLMDGIYHCQGMPCRELEAPNPKLHECEPNELYREETTFCSCSATGHWRSINCRERYLQLPLKRDPIKKNLRTNIPCKPNDLYITDCDVCLCDARGSISFSTCTTRSCLKRNKGDLCTPGDVYRSANEFCICSYVNYFIDRLCIRVTDEVVQQVSPDNLEHIIDFREKRSIIDVNYCDGNATMYIDCNICTCEKHKFVCTKYDCDEDAPILRSEKAKLVLELTSEYEKCIPGQNYKYRCNTCVCNKKGEPLCTSMICLQDIVVDSASLRQMISSY